MFTTWPEPEAALERPALQSSDSQFTWRQLRDRVRERAVEFADLKGRRVGLLFEPAPHAVANFLALVNSDVNLFLMAHDTAVQDLDEWSVDLQLDAIIQLDGSVRHLQNDTSKEKDSAGSITILTSGTTGKPKAAKHTWDSLSRPVRRGGAEAPRWLLAYRPHLYAGLQVMLQSLLNSGTLVLSQAGSSAEDVAKLAAGHQVQFASATPSWWRWLMTLASEEHLQAIPLDQITLGGEAVDQATLDGLKRNFPNTRLIHIYATTELGRCFSVTDGMSGFPTRFLEQVSPDGVEMRIEDGELIVRSANAMSGYDRSHSASPRQEWFHTGDLVEVNGDRAVFVGRKSDMINVGGNKVYPLEVENVIRRVAGVADTRIYGEASSIVGELVKCDLVITTGFDAAEVETQVRKQCLDQLNNYQRPRFIRIVDDIPRTSAGKTDRSQD